VRRVCAGPSEAAELLARPDRFGLARPSELTAVAQAAQRWLARASDAMVLNGPSCLAGHRVRLGDRYYRVRGLVAHGDSAAVLRARWEHRLGEEVILKVMRAPADRDLLRAELDLLRELGSSDAQGAEFFSTLLPQPVAVGELPDGAGGSRFATAYRWRSGFHHTLADVRRAHPAGVDPRVALWIHKRLLELLGWLRRAGAVHGAIVPPHVLVHPRDHGAVLVGFTCGARLDASRRARLPAQPSAWRHHYPTGVGPGAAVATGLDVLMATRCVLAVLGGDPQRGLPPAHLPAELQALLTELADSAGATRDMDGWEALARLKQTARQVYGPPAHHPLAMPGW